MAQVAFGSIMASCEACLLPGVGQLPPWLPVVKLFDEYTSESKYRFGLDGLHPF